MLALRRGDAVVHQSDLLHGVKVESGERWSWILWFRDSETCDDFGHEWSRDCARNGDAICQNLHANKVARDAVPSLTLPSTPAPPSPSPPPPPGLAAPAPTLPLALPSTVTRWARRQGSAGRR